jgi:hypothetical protein
MLSSSWHFLIPVLVFLLAQNAYAVQTSWDLSGPCQQYIHVNFFVLAYISGVFLEAGKSSINND